MSQSINQIPQPASTQDKSINLQEIEHNLFSEGPVFLMVWGFSPEWPVHYVSQNVTAILGYTPEELIAP